ncbi:MAG: diguanylate cyclase [Dongiaceae bacterium]
MTANVLVRHGPARRSGARAPRRRLARSLFAAGGPLAAYPGPALIVGAGTTVLAANEAALPLAAMIGAGGAPEVTAAINSALAGASAQLQPFQLAGAGTPTALELLVLPYAEAEAALLLGRDATLERSLRAALVESRQRYKDLVEASSDFAWETGPDGSFRFVSPGGALGHRADDLVGRQPAEFVIAADGADPGFPFSARDPIAGVELWFRTATGDSACLVAACRPLFDHAGEWRGTRGLARDMTEARAREADFARVRHRERLLAYLVRTIRHEVDPQNMLTAAAAAVLPALAAGGCRVHRLDDDGSFRTAVESGAPADIDETPVLAAIRDGEATVERVVGTVSLLAMATRHGRRANGALSLWRLADQPPWDDDDRFLVGELANQLGTAIQQIADQEALQTMSRTDPLTGLLNRRSLAEELRRRYRDVTADGRGAALLYLDLDNLKAVNDRGGHAQGDAALVAAARILTAHTRGRDVVARVGGDEFVVWLEDIDETAARAKAAELVRAAGDLARFSAAAAPLRLSVGVAVRRPRSREDLDALTARADAAMYEAKRAGKGRYAVAAPPPGVAEDAAP